MGLSPIKCNIIKRITESPRLAKAADLFGSAISSCTFGTYKTGLSRSAYLLSGKVKVGDMLSVEDGVVRRGCMEIMRSNIFKRIYRSDISITPEMCTPDGMAASLRWDIVGSGPQILLKATYIMQSALLFGILHNSTIDYLRIGSYYGELFNPGYAIAASQVLLYLFMTMPCHKLLTLFIGSNDKNIMLSNVDGDKKAYIKTADLTKKKCSGFVSLRSVFYHGIFVHEGLIEDLRDLVVVHEKAHLHNASEYSACRLEHEKFFKVLMYERQGLKSKLSYIHNNFDALFAILMGQNCHNIFSIYYAFRYKNIYYYHEELFAHII